MRTADDILEVEKQRIQVMTLLDGVKAGVEVPIHMSTRALVDEWVRQYIEGSTVAQQTELMRWAQKIYRHLNDICQTAPDITHAVMVHRVLVFGVAQIASKSIQDRLDLLWAEENAAHCAAIEPAVQELRTFLSIETPGLGTRTGVTIDPAIFADITMDAPDEWCKFLALFYSSGADEALGMNNEKSVGTTGGHLSGVHTNFQEDVEMAE
ncbi:unnamed protein product [Cutaneotrichosporon oleaginosum]